ncbi:hypothetical protein EYF80_059353 [Liparis tanakae]|uniref:Uncharacterized protein n=1 Tax=Liparis tanakae TaxID=230148 RepID=A0A4Z2EQ57_9TELE|nr:hypothetical protein EYF80_059353 [Liparis tanakae]
MANCSRSSSSSRMLSLCLPPVSMEYPAGASNTHGGISPARHDAARRSPIMTGKPGGRRRVMKSRSLANSPLEMAMRSMMGTTCSARDRGQPSVIRAVFPIPPGCSGPSPLGLGGELARVSDVPLSR